MGGFEADSNVNSVNGGWNCADPDEADETLETFDERYLFKAGGEGGMGDGLHLFGSDADTLIDHSENTRFD